MNRITSQSSNFFQFLFQSLQVEQMMHILTFRLNQLLENVLTPCQLLLSRSFCRTGASEILAKVVTISRSVKLTTQAENVEHMVH